LFAFSRSFFCITCCVFSMFQIFKTPTRRRHKYTTFLVCPTGPEPYGEIVRIVCLTGPKLCGECAWVR
jgi:hypothetical protein